MYLFSLDKKNLISLLLHKNKCGDSTIPSATALQFVCVLVPSDWWLFDNGLLEFLESLWEGVTFSHL